MARNLIVANNAVGSIDGSLSSSATTLILNDISNFPILTDVDDYCILTLIRESDGAIEYVECTSQNIANRSYEVLRGVEDTTPLVFTEGDEVRNLLTKGQIDGFLKEPDAFNNYIDGFGSNGRHINFTGDIDSIRSNSLYLVLNSVATGDHPPFSAGTGKYYFLHNFQFTNDDNGIQMAYSMNAGDNEVFTRRLSVTWGNWEEFAMMDNVVPLAGNAGNPMTGYLVGSNLTRIENFREVRLGTFSDLSNFIDFRSSSDPSQSDYSARIIRNSGVNGDLVITNKGSGKIDLRSDGDVKLGAGSGIINCDNNYIKNVLNPVTNADAANKQYVDSLVGPGALLGSISLVGLAEGGNEKIIAGSASWDNYGYIKVIIEDLKTTGNNTVNYGLGVKDSNGSWCDLPPGWSTGITNERYLSPIDSAVVRPRDTAFGASYEFDLYSSGEEITPFLRSVNNVNGMWNDVYQAQGYGIDSSSFATGAPTAMKSWLSSFSSWSNRSIGLKTSYTGSDTISTGTLKIIGFTYPS